MATVYLIEVHLPMSAHRSVPPGFSVAQSAAQMHDYVLQQYAPLTVNAQCARRLDKHEG